MNESRKEEILSLAKLRDKAAAYDQSPSLAARTPPHRRSSPLILFPKKNQLIVFFSKHTYYRSIGIFFLQNFFRSCFRPYGVFFLKKILRRVDLPEGHNRDHYDHHADGAGGGGRRPHNFFFFSPGRPGVLIRHYIGIRYSIIE